MTYRVILVCLVCAGCAGDPPVEACPRLEVEPLQVSIADARLGEARTFLVELANGCVGEGALATSVSLVDAPPALQLIPPAASLPPGQSASAQLTWTPAGYAPVRASLSIASDDPERSTLSIPIDLAVDPDQDGDGFEAVEAGGTDCADADATRRPDATEVDDGVDQDCDGLVDEDFVAARDVAITEIFASPRSGAQARQWIEVLNRSTRAVDLSAWELQSGETTLTIEAGAVLEVGARGLLAGTDDREVLGVDSAPIGRLQGAELLSLDEGWILSLVAGDLEVAAVGGPGFRPGSPGASMQLDPILDPSLRGDDAQGWCAASTLFTETEAGTPGAANTWCPGVDHDGDGEPLATDCDDTRPDRRPGRLETLDGIDQDCSGRADDIELPRHAYVQVSDFIVASSPEAGIGDFDDDGELEIVLVSRSSALTATYRIADWLREDGPAEAGLLVWGDEASFRDTQSVVAVARDVTGDGVDDAVVGHLYQSRGYPVVSVNRVSGGGGTWVVAQDEARWEDVQVTALDADGDGVAEVLAAASDADARSGRVWWMDVRSGGLSLDVTDVATTWRGEPSSSAGVGVGSGDLDGDGYEDLLIRSASVGSQRGVTILAGGTELPADGSLASVTDVSVPGGIPQPGGLAAPRLGDLDGDGELDLVVSDSDTQRIWWEASDLLSKGARDPDVELAIPSTRTCSTLLADLDGDGDDELISGLTSAAGLNGLFAWDADALVEPFDETAWQAGVPRLNDREAVGCWLVAADIVEGGGTSDLLVGAPGANEAWIIRSE